MPPLKNISNRRFGKLIILERAPNRGKHTMWYAQCDCGEKTIVGAAHLADGHTTSCGCYGRTFKSLPPGEAAFNALFAQYAKQHEFSLSKHEFRILVFESCFYCGTPPKQIYENNARYYTTPILYNGIDRVDNSKGYQSSNVVTCCKHCNRAKRKMSQREFIKRCHKIAQLHPI